MNKDSKKIQTYLKIIDFLVESNRRQFYPKVSDIVNQLEKSDIVVSERTVQRYLNDLNTEFAIYIDKKGKRGGYEIAIDEIPEFENIYSVLKILENAGHFNELISKNNDSLRYVLFDGKQAKGVEFFEDIVNAIRRKKIIRIRHRKFNGEESVREVEPWLLKEYNKRWYLYGMDSLSQSTRFFGLDRIKQVEISDKSFKPVPIKELKERFDRLIGISGEEKSPEHVIIEFNNEQIDYFRTHPWCPDAKIRENKDGGWIVEMKVVVNYELKQLILMNHANVKVVEPVHLVKEIKNMLKKALLKY
jgi:predicted DNA-binding transcriptional regulator YafY